MVCAYCSPQQGGGVNPDPSVNSANINENPFTRPNTEHAEHIEVLDIELNDIDASGIDIKSSDIKSPDIKSNGIHIEAAQLETFYLNAGENLKCLVQPGYMVITTLPHKHKILEAIEELHYRQDELKQDFSLAIAQLVKLV